MGNINFNWYKIGISSDPMERHRVLEVSLPFPLTLMHAQPMRSRLHARRAEIALHWHFDSVRLNGEWFHDIEFGEFWNTLRRL